MQHVQQSKWLAMDFLGLLRCVAAVLGWSMVSRNRKLGRAGNACITIEQVKELAAQRPLDYICTQVVHGDVGLCPRAELDGARDGAVL